MPAAKRVPFLKQLFAEPLIAVWVLIQAVTLGWVLGAVLCSCTEIPQAAKNLQDSFDGVKASKVNKDTWTKVYLRQYSIIAKMADAHPDVDFSVTWQPCGQENAWYYPESHQIVLCTELAAYPGMATFAAAHEFGHAIAMQQLNDEDEASADTLAVLAMLDYGYQDDLLNASLYFRHEHLDHWPGDPHPSARFRAWYLACMEEGWEMEQEASGRYSLAGAQCSMLYSGMDIYWTNRLRLGSNPTE